MSDLTARLKAVIEERLRVARAAPRVWRSELMILREAVAFVALNDPADAILAGEWALGVLERHAPRDYIHERSGLACAWCAYGDGEQVPWPCIEIEALAKRFGVSE